MAIHVVSNPVNDLRVQAGVQRWRKPRDSSCSQILYINAHFITFTVSYM